MHRIRQTFFYPDRRFHSAEKSSEEKMTITESIAVSKGKKEADRPMSFKEQLIRLRKQRGLSQEQLGQHIGVSRQTVSKWELGVSLR